jgi:hypothetical protein
MFRLLLAAIFLGVVMAAYLGAGFALSRRRKLCPSCQTKGLKRINWFLCNPPPNRSFFACDECRREFVQIDRYDGAENPMIPRVGSPWEHSSGWDTVASVRSSPLGQG